jgi:adenine/guanine phosphoribosyltransferase-like PRPP-binding protein
MMYDLFLSYNQKDGEYARQIADVLASSGFKVFFDPNTPINGLTLRPALASEINDSRCFALLHGPNCLGSTQRLEANYAVDRVAAGQLDFRNVILSPCQLESPHGNALLAYANLISIHGSHFHISHHLVKWLDRRLHSLGTYHLYGVGSEDTVVLQLISQPDVANTWEMDWQTYETLVRKLYGDLRRRAVHPDIVLGINEGGLAIATVLAGMLERKPTGYLKHQGAPPRKIVSEHMALPKVFSRKSSRETVVLLVDSELKTGNALRAVFPELQKCYPDARFYYAALFARLNERYWKHGTLPAPGSRIHYHDLLAATQIGTLGLEGVLFGGLFGEGRVDPPFGVR